MNCRKRKQQLMETYLNESKKPHSEFDLSEMFSMVAETLNRITQEYIDKIKAKKSLDNV